MREEFEIGEAEAYEEPLLVEAGDYAEVTNGSFGRVFDGWLGRRWS